MKISIIIPAYNEEKYIERCLKSVLKSIEANQQENVTFDIIVSDNQSTDATVSLSRAFGVEVVNEPFRQISRVRNRGAKDAGGDWFIFIDADSILNPKSIEAVIRCIRETADGNEDKNLHVYASRYVGGGSIVGVDEAPWYGVLAFRTWNVISRILQCAAGSFIFCRADAFREVGGFSRELFAAEEVDLTKKLKQWGKKKGLRFIILKETPHISSGRKFRDYSLIEIFGQLFRLIVLNRFALRSRKHLPFFYEGRR